MFILDLNTPKYTHYRNGRAHKHLIHPRGWRTRESECRADTRSIRARKPLFYANLRARCASNKLFARSSPFMGGIERFAFPFCSVRILRCTICRSRRRKRDQIFAANKAYGGDKYLSDVTDPPTYSSSDFRKRKNEKIHLYTSLIKGI